MTWRCGRTTLASWLSGALVVFVLLQPSRGWPDEPGTAGSGAAKELSTEQRTAIAQLPQIKGRPNPRLYVERAASKRIVGTLTADVTIPSMKVDTWVFITPEPPNLDGQERVHVEASPSAEAIGDQTPLQRPLLRSVVSVESPEQPSSVAYSCQLTIQLYSRALKPRGRRTQPAVALTTRERSLYLRPDSTFDYTTAEFADWKSRNQFVRTRRESEVDFAQRVFRTITNGYRYMYDPQQDRTASKLCQTDQTDCGGLSILFATVLRSEAIPARILVGRWATSAKTTPGKKREDKFHVIAEFYAEGIGWIPVDGASAVLHDPTPQKLEFFGNQAGNFVALHIDTDLTFDTGLWGDHTARFFQVPKFWFRGRGEFEERTFNHDWSVTETEGPSDANSTPDSFASDHATGKRAYVFLPLTHLRQQNLLCAPTSASIVLLHYGMKIPPQRVKQLANSVATDKSFQGTYFKDIVSGLEAAGLTWKNRQFATNATGFAEGVDVLEKSLRRGYPVIIDTFVPPDGHTVVVNGIDPNRKLVSLVDPNIPSPGLRRVSYAEFEQLWRSVISDQRGCILTAPPSR